MFIIILFGYNFFYALRWNNNGWKYDKVNTKVGCLQCKCCVFDWNAPQKVNSLKQKYNFVEWYNLQEIISIFSWIQLWFYEIIVKEYI